MKIDNEFEWIKVEFVFSWGRRVQSRKMSTVRILTGSVRVNWTNVKLTLNNPAFSRCFSSQSSPKHVKVAIVGSGPAALYTTQYILKNIGTTGQSALSIDIYEKLPVPFGLVRYGVAPDHQDVKNVINSFTDTILKPSVNFYGNVSIGQDLKISELMNAYTAVVLAYGSHSENYLNIKVIWILIISLLITN